MKTEPINPLQALFSALLNPQPTDQKFSRNINWKSLFTQENIESLSLNNDLLGFYANYLQKTCFVKESSIRTHAHRADVFLDYYCSFEENFSRINNAIKKLNFDYCINTDGQFTKQGIVDLTTAILLKRRFKDYPTIAYTNYRRGASSGELKDLFNLLLDPKTRKLHHVSHNRINYDDEHLTFTFSLPEGKKQIVLHAFDVSRVITTLDKTLLDLYVNYMREMSLIKENELKFEHPAYHYAIQYYFRIPRFRDEQFKLPNNFCSSPSPYKFKVKNLSGLEELKSLKSEVESEYDIYILIIQPGESFQEFPEVYCSQPGKDLIERNLIALHHKTIFQDDLKYLIDFDSYLEFNSYLECIEKIENILKAYFSIDQNDYCQLTTQSIMDLSSYVILEYVSKNSSEKYKFATKPVEKMREAKSCDVEKLLNYLLDSKSVKSHVIDKDRMSITFNLINNTTDIISLNNFYTETNINGLSLNKPLLERYADYICREFFIDESEFKFDHRAYACAASYVMQQGKKLSYFEEKINGIFYPAINGSCDLLYERAVHFKTVPYLEQINELTISPDHVGDLYVILVKPSYTTGITETYCCSIDDDLVLSKPMKLHHTVEFQEYRNILNGNNFDKKEQCYQDIINKLKNYFSINNHYKLNELAIAHVTSAIILKHGLKGREIQEYQRETSNTKILSENDGEKQLKKLLTYLLNPKSIKYYSCNKNDLSVTFHLSEHKKEIIPLQCLFSRENLNKLSIENEDLDFYVHFMKQNTPCRPSASLFEPYHLGYHYAVAHYLSNDSYEINKLLRNNNYKFASQRYQLEFYYLSTENLDELDYSALESKKNNQIYIIFLNKPEGQPEIYYAPFYKSISKENLINLTQKFFLKNYLKKNPDIDIQDIKQCYPLQSLLQGEIQKLYSDTFEIFSTATISYIATTIILFYFLNNCKREPQDGFRVKSWRKNNYSFSIGHFLSNYVAVDQAFLSYSRWDGSLFGNKAFSSNAYYIYIYSHNAPGLSISPNSDEDEILVPLRQDAYYSHVGGVENCRFYTVKFGEHKQNLSLLNRPSENIIKFFIEYLMLNFFSKEFQDASLCRTDLVYRDLGITVYKPNHGILHAIRQSERIPHLLKAFAVIIAQPDFAKFCQDIMRKETLLILDEKVSAQQLLDELYLIAGSCSIGRESELSFEQNPTKYAEYRSNSMKRFTKFIQDAEHPCQFKISDKRLIVYQHVLKHLGDPNSMKDLTGFHLWVMQLVNTTHVLDVARCFPANSVESILLDRLGLLMKDSKLEHIKQLINFSVSWLQLTGDRIETGYSINGFPIDPKAYDSQFALYSTTQISACLDMLRSSPAIVFSSEEEKQNFEAMEKIAEHVFSNLFHNRLKLKDRWAPFKNLETLIRNIVNLNLVMPELVRHYLFEIILKKLTPEITHKSKEECARALTAAAEEEHISAKSVQYLLEAKISPNATDSQDKNALMQAILTSGKEQVEKTKLLLEFKGNPNLLNWKRIMENSFEHKSARAVGLVAQLAEQGHPELLAKFLDSPTETLTSFDWKKDINELKGNSLFKLTLSLIEKDSLSAKYLEKLFHSTILLSFNWGKELIEIFNALLMKGVLEYDRALSILPIEDLNFLKQRYFDKLFDFKTMQYYMQFIIDLKLEKSLSDDALKFQASNPVRASSLYFIIGSQLRKTDYFKKVIPENQFYEEAQKKLSSNL